MKKQLALGTLLALALSALAVGTASASNGGTYKCDGGKMIVNVTYTITNDPDSGVNGNDWATDTIKRHMQVFDLGDGTYCAAVNDTGSFVTLAGDSPNGTGAVDAGISGRLNGGYVAMIPAATLDPSPAYATHGNLGSFDSSARPSFLSYFSGSPDWDFASWGWAYHTAKNGNWLNAAAGNSGDITG